MRNGIKTTVRRIVLLAAALLFLCCGALAEEQTLTLSEVCSAILPDMPELTEMLPEDFSDILGIEPGSCTDMLWLAGSGESGREILALRAVDEEAASDIQEQLSFYLEQRRKESRNYFPDAYALLMQTDVARNGLTVVLVVGPDAAAETEVLLGGA